MNASSPAITAVFFDLGGVLVRTTDLEPRRRWERRFGMRDWELQDLFFNSPIGQAAQVGQVTTADVWAHVAATLGLDADELRRLQADFWRGDTFDESLLALIRSLHTRYKTGVISNAMSDARRRFADKLDGELFDILVFSGEEGVKKPDPEIFRRALMRLGVRSEESIFVDDVPENVAAAQALGMHGIHFTSGADLHRALVRLTGFTGLAGIDGVDR
ncbi:MAG: haloacid dehalogenase [Candidatus Roseilinea sp.]|nr:MAG: haloacid dehalogenase [Candidatus Roseilinea sp.]